jgi:hypothetical protein
MDVHVAVPLVAPMLIIPKLVGVPQVFVVVNKLEADQLPGFDVEQKPLI